jgi:hypothetical protein
MMEMTHKEFRFSGWFLTALTLIFSFSAASATAQESSWSLALKGGPAFMMKSKSKAIPHLFKPMVRAELSRSLTKKTSVGLELATIATSNTNYRLIKISALFLADLHHGSLYRLWVRGGFGLGSHPSIMVEDLKPTKAPLNVHVDLGLAMSWQLPFEKTSLGLEIITDNLAILSLVGSLRFEL